ncbi:MAG: Ig-like domain-containing protein, partial [Candidatus Promineifilaceae bacterium]|nr:Ig-like domain-containing protein [Candidatus Promineifilaceae bacterium]
MAQRSLRHAATLFLLLVLFLAACRREEAPSAPLSTETPESESPSEPTATTVEPTATTEAETESLSFDWPPQLVYSSPASGQETLLDGAITLRFDQPMDQESVAEAFQVTEADADQVVDGTFQWPRPDTMIFTPLDQLERSQHYRVTVADTAVAQNGKPLRQEINLQVETVGFLRVSQTSPSDGGAEVHTDAAITVAFNRPVVPLVTTGQQSDLPQPLSFQPDVDGQGSWISTSIYRFVPSEPLAGATNYQVTVESGLEDVTGGILSDPVTFTFTTLQPSVVSTSPGNRDRLVSPVGPYTVSFNMPMDRSTTEAAISLSPGASLSYEWAEDNRSVTLTPQNPLARGEDYTLNVAASATSSGGDASLNRAVTAPFTVAPQPAVISTDPADGAEAHRFQFGFNIRFSAPMDPDTLEGELEITPSPDDVDLHFFEDTDGFAVSVGFELERDTRYSVSVPATAADIWGVTLEEDYAWSFTTPPPDPLISFNLPNQPAISQLSTSLPSDVQIVYRNVSEIEVLLRDVGLPVGQLMRFYTGSPNDAGPSGPIVNEWTLPVESNSDEAEVITLELADGGTLPTGVYYLQADGPRMPQEVIWWQNQNNYLIVADTNLVVKQTPESVHVWATDLASGQPAPDLNVTLYSSAGRILDQSITDDDGLASFEYEPVELYLESVMVVANGPKEAGFGLASSGWNHRIQAWNFGLSENTSQEPDQYIYLYTDRPIYRPGDTVHFKGILRDTNYGRYPLPTDETVSLRMMFLNEYSEVDFSFSATADENGEFSGEYEIPDDASLGNYQLYYSNGDVFTERTFTVAEYRAPDFQVAVTAPETDQLRGQAGEVTVEATYFFGGSASDLPVNWIVFADDYNLPWDGPYYAFGDNADFYYEPPSLYNFGGRGSFGESILSGTGTTDENGRLRIELPADMLADRDPGSVRVTVQADVMDITSFPITGRAEVIYHAAESYVGVRTADYITTSGNETAVELITIDWDANPVPNAEVEVVFYQRDWDPVRDTQFGVYYTRWEATDTEVARLSVTTDDDGQGEAVFVPDSGGSYIAVATVTDALGNEQTSSTPFWVMNDTFTGWRSDPREKRMDLVTDQRTYRPGDVAQILVQSPFEGPVQAWLTVERGEVIEQRIITLPTGSDVVELPITRNFAPNAFVSIAAVKGIDDSNPFADMRLGMTELEVSPAHLGLNLSLTPQDDLLSPGDTAVYDILITNSVGQPVQANFSLALVDLAVLSLLPDNAPDIHQALYSRQPIRSLTGSGLIQSGEGLEIEIPQEAPGLGGGGGDGEAIAAPALEEDDDETRRDFPDTAFWQAQVSTDSEGRATVEIPLPDTLTTWRLSSKAVSDYTVTSETLVGQNSVDLVSTLPLLVRPVTPRFFVVGDRLEVGAVIHNNTGTLQEVTVSLEAEGLTLEDNAETTISLPDGQRQLVRWTATVNDVRSVDMTFRAEAGEYRDATKPTFGIPPDQLVPVVRYAGEDFVGTAGVIEEAGRTVEAILLPESVDERQGDVQMQLSPSLAAALVDALQATDLLIDNRNICAPTVADELLPNVATAEALNALNLSEPRLQNEIDQLINKDISRLESLQLRSGGWGWCYSSEVDPFLTAYVTLAL